MSDPAIQATDLTRRFGDLVAVNDLALEVLPGEVFGFLGHNGAGKTTTIRLLNGVLIPSAGEVRVLGFNPVTEGPELRKRTGVLTENPSNDERLTAHENLRFFADLYGLPAGQIPRRISELLEMFDLADRADERVGGYSKGMKQRLALARALLHDPALLYLDEPTSGLDPVAARLVHDLIHRLKGEGRTIVLCTHNLVEAQRLCDRVAVLELGHVLALGTPVELARRLGQRLGVEVEVEPGQTQTAVQLLGNLSGIGAVNAEDGVIKVAGATHRVIPDLVSTLVRGGVRVYRVTPQDASLEDVYFALHDGGHFMEAS